MTTPPTSAKSLELASALLEQAQAAGLDLDAPRRLSLHLKNGTHMTIDLTHRGCLRALTGLASAMANGGIEVFHDPAAAFVLRASDIMVATIQQAPPSAS